MAETKVPSSKLLVRGKSLNVKGEYRNPIISKIGFGMILVHHFEDSTYEITIINGLEPQLGWRTEDKNVSMVPLKTLHNALSGKDGYAAAISWPEAEKETPTESSGCYLIMDEKIAASRFRTYRIPLSKLEEKQSLASYCAFIGEFMMRMEQIVMSGEGKGGAGPRKPRRRRGRRAKTEKKTQNA